MNIMDVSHQH